MVGRVRPIVAASAALAIGVPVALTDASGASHGVVPHGPGADTTSAVGTVSPSELVVAGDDPAWEEWRLGDVFLDVIAVLGDDYLAAYVQRDQGSKHLVITVSGDDDEKQRAALQLLPAAAATEFRSGNASFAEHFAALEQFAVDINELRLPFEVTLFDSFHRVEVGAVVDQEGIGIARAQLRPATDRLEAELGVTVDVVVAEGPTRASADPNNNWPYRAGKAQATCTAGWVVGSEGNLSGLHAGHCSGLNPNNVGLNFAVYFLAGPHIGNVSGTLWKPGPAAGPIDVEWVPLTYGNANSFVFDGSDTGLDVVGENLSVNLNSVPAHKRGKTTGLTSGSIYGLTLGPQAPSGVYPVQICVPSGMNNSFGDSGSPVYTYNSEGIVALGVLSAQNANCASTFTALGQFLPTHFNAHVATK